MNMNPDKGASLPRLPEDLEDLAALDNWYAAWNSWIAQESAQRDWPWLVPLTPAMLHDMVAAERRRRAGEASEDQPAELDAARGELNILENHLRTTDPLYEQKRATLVPILQPIFQHLPPGKWRELFEQAYAKIQLPSGSENDESERKLTEARNGLKELEGLLRNRDPEYAAKMALLVPVLNPVLSMMPPAKWVGAFEAAYGAVALPNVSTISGSPEPVASRKDSRTEASGAKPYKRRDHVVLFSLASHPGGIGICKSEAPEIGGAFFLDFSRPLQNLERKLLGRRTKWVGIVTCLGVPIIHESRKVQGYLASVDRSDPRFAEIVELWRERFPSQLEGPVADVGGLKIIADFGIQFPDGS